MKGAQLGATEAALNWLGYIIHHAPGLALLVMPSLDMARRNTRTRLDPMIEATPALREVIAAPRSRDAYNSRLHQELSRRHAGHDGREQRGGAAIDAGTVSRA